jgi:uncharacterized protein
LETFDCEAMMTLMQRVVEDAADTGNCVIVGRGAPYFLRDRAGTLTVFLFAPREFKFKLLLAHGQNEKEANELLDTVDQDRVAFVKHYFGKEWPHRPLYHAMLNTALGDDLTMVGILNLMEAVNKRETSP